MIIKDIFSKKIDRDIKGVIKIGQEDNLSITQELEEYVVTRELRAHIDKFFNAYKKGIDGHTDKMGVWISGFFGSGKSHLLKILSYLLENKDVEGHRAVEYFDDKLEDQMLLADMKRSGELSKDVILFNIDSKADSDSKMNKEAIVKVFNKVFDEHLGYCGSIPWLAELERKIDKEGTYGAFKERFKEINGSEWESARSDFYFIEDEIVQALSEATSITEDAARNWYNKAQEHYTLSVEKFAEKVKSYIESKGSNHHVIFLVDEIGQYIGDDTGLMLNLQTVTEDLGTMCGGKAWIIVTSQQAIDSVIKVKGSDFSKIQARFDTRLSLSSANVDEVIKKRLLVKQGDNGAEDILRLTYQEKESIIKNLLIFSANTPEMKRYKSEDDFVDVYPFVPYQFYMLQEVFNSIRIHGASGKSLSEGERSLLSAFQESAVRFKDSEIGMIMPFHAFYHTIESFLDHDIRIVIEQAKDNERLNDFDVDVLRLLFLIKYLGDKLPPNLENITTLMVDHIDTDKLALSKKVEESLVRLHREAIIQKNGDAYIFLTNSEQDINHEIKNMPVDYSEVIKSLSAVVFDGLLNADNKFAYTKDHIFTYNHKFDSDFYSSQKGEMTLHIVTPSFAGSDDEDSQLKMMTTQDNSVIFRLPDMMGYFDEMEEAIQIESYLRKSSVSTIPEVERIKLAKSEEIKARKARVAEQLGTAISRATIYAYGQKLDIKEKSPQSRIDEAFRVHVENKYSKLGMMVPFVFSKANYSEILKEDTQNVMPGTMSNKQAYDEILTHIDNMDKMSIPITIKSIVEKYTRDPYHWRDEDIKGLVLRMLNFQEINLIYGSEHLDRKEIEKLIGLISKDSNLESIKVKKRIKTSGELLKVARDVAKKAFNSPYMPDDENSLMHNLKELVSQEKDGIVNMLRRYEGEIPYPGRDILLEGKELLEELLCINDEPVFFKRVNELKDDIEVYAKEAEDVKDFLKNQAKYFDEAYRQTKIFDKNKTYVSDKEAISTAEQMQTIIDMPCPYGHITKLVELRSKFVEIFGDLLEKESESIRGVVQDNQKSTESYLDSLDLPADVKTRLQGKISKVFQKIIRELEATDTFVDAIYKKDEAGKAKENLINEMDAEFEKIVPIYGTVPSPPKKQIKKISLTSLAHGLKDVESETDLDEVIARFKEFVLKEMEENTVIKFI